MSQLLLIPDPRPLDQRLGRQFFRTAPRRPGVYLMKDAENNVLYVGKAKDLKQRLGHYRVANPDRMPRRHLRMVTEVQRIEFQFCVTASAALEREAKLLRSLKPKFNRAGVWPGKTRFIAWRVQEEHLELTVVETPGADWQRFGPLGSGAIYLQRTIARLLWLALNPTRAFAELPAGWARGDYIESAAIRCGESIKEVIAVLESFFWDEADSFLPWLESKFAVRTHPFDRQAIEAELESLKEFGGKQKQKEQNRQQLALL
ncbi:MAG: nucleotide excision repair endonuclease [Verrucomicrobia bacterium]|nr:nucleotide excision repair endonuclease [Verrucomicrobiota bacterium]